MDSQNRRNYFRIDDQLGVSYQILDQQAYQQHRQEYRLQRLQDHQQQLLEHKIRSGIRGVEIRYPELGEILGLLNQKIEQLGHSSLEPGPERDETEPRPVNISASGIAFFQDSPLGHNTHLEIILTLYPNNEQIKLFGLVVDCIEQKTTEIEHYKISVEFDYLVEEDREELVQYIMRQQNIALRLNSGIDDALE